MLVRLRLLAPILVAALALAPAALGAPAISGADGDAWNATETPATYTITGSAPGVLLAWQLVSGGTAVPGFSGTGASPLIVTLTNAPDGAFTLDAADVFASDTTRGARVFTIDTVAPTVSLTRPADGAVYQRRDRIAADYACGGATTCTAPVAAGAPIDTARTGARSFTVTATDAAGNTAQQRVDYRVTAEPAPPVQTLSLPTPRAGNPLPVRNPERLRPSPGISLPLRRPVLGWRRVASARLYNLQVFRVDGKRATKVLSAFPSRTLYRVPAGRLAWGERYVWRVWPLIGNRYTAVPQGQSWFRTRRPVPLTPAELLRTQRMAQAALRRTAAISAWLDAGLTADDLRDGGLGREDFAADVTLTGDGAAIQNGVAGPRPLVVAPAPRTTAATRLPVTVRQLRVNQRIAQTALRRAEALGRRLRGGLTGGDLRPGVIEATKLAPGLLVDHADPAGPAPAASRTVVARASRTTPARVRRTERQIEINQRISQAALREANALSQRIARGLTGTSFRDGAISAVSISPALR